MNWSRIGEIDLLDNFLCSADLTESEAWQAENPRPEFNDRLRVIAPDE